MSCVVVATSPALAACQSPSRRHCDDPGGSLFGDVRSSSHLVTCLDLLPSSPLLYATPKLSPFSSSCKPSPSAHSPLPAPSPRFQCSPRTPSWTSPIGTPSARTLCSCAGLSICSSSSCTRTSASPVDAMKWKSSSLEKRFVSDAHLDGKFAMPSSNSTMEPPSPRVGSPVMRCSRGAMPPPQYSLSAIEPPSPRFGGTHSVFPSPRPLSRPTSASAKFRALVDDRELQQQPGSATKGDNLYSGGSSWISSAEGFLRLDIPNDRVEAASEPITNSSGVGEAVAAAGDVAVHIGRPSSPPLKRKRPPKLEIPPGVNLGTANNVPHIVDLGEECLNEMTVEGSYYGISCKKGRRETLEDTQRAMPDLHGDPGQAFFGVFDGHGGRKAADFAAENLVHKIMDAMESREGEADVEAAVRTGYLTTDAEFLEQRVKSGASCVTALMKDGFMVVANAGDCRAVLSRAGQAEALTCDHRAGREDERERIENLGGFVDNLTGTWRVQGTLAVSRGIGDLHLKEWITAEPDVQKLRITSDCEFLILASDGLWDAVTNQEAVDTARALLQPGRLNDDVMDLQIPLAMASSSLSKGSDDRDADSEQRQGVHVDEGKTTNSLEMEPSDPYDSRLQSSNDDDELDICVGTMDAEMPNVGFPEPPLPSAGPAAACKRLVEMSVKRGCHDDISVMIVDLQHFHRKLGFHASGSSS